MRAARTAEGTERVVTRVTTPPGASRHPPRVAGREANSGEAGSRDSGEARQGLRRIAKSLAEVAEARRFAMRERERSAASTSTTRRRARPVAPRPVSYKHL